MLIVVVWWLWMQAIGLAALPLAYRFFGRLGDRGLTLARPLGLLLTGYLFWLGGSLGFLRNSLGGALFSPVAVAAFSWAHYLRGRRPGGAALAGAAEPGLLDWLRANGRLILASELLFAGALALWSLLRAYSPEITTAGGEKFMEIMYLNSIGRSEVFPSHDAWLSGYAISYYYFGYVLIAMLTRLSGFPAHLTFNVGLALLFALTCTGAFGLVYNLVKRDGASTAPAGRGESGGQISPAGTLAKPSRPIVWGLLGAILVAVLGNLEGLLEVLYSARLLPYAFWRWLDIQELNVPFDPSVPTSFIPSRSGWWWWKASRVLHDLDPLGNSMGIQPIDEFPGFSFLLGDMHPHVLGLPFVLLALAVALRALLGEPEKVVDRQGSRPIDLWLDPLRRLSPLVPLCLGALGFLNTWDFPIYLLVFLAAYALARWGQEGRLGWPLVRDVSVTGAAVAVLGFLFYLPFYIGFQSQAGGILPNLYVGTRFRQYFVMFGPFLVALAGLLVALALGMRRTVAAHSLFSGQARRLLGSWAGWTAGLILVPFGLMFLIAFAMPLTPQGREFLEGVRRVPEVYQIVGDESWGIILGRLALVKLRTWVMPLVVAGMAAMGIVLLRWSLPPSRPDGDGERTTASESSPAGGRLPFDPGLQFVLLCAAAGLLLTLSVEYVYLVDVFRVRMNTVFKFYFQAWVLMAVATAYAVYWLGRRGGRLGALFLSGFWLLFAMGMVYPVLGNISRAGNFAHPPTLDGTAYLAERHPEDYAAVQWLNANVPGAPVILEAPGSGGSSYVYEGRVSALTGLPTLVGWAGHELQWRGSSAIQGEREPDIKTIYNTTDSTAARALLDRYGVTYVYVGPLERSTYETRGLDKFESFMDVVYQGEGVAIYRVRER